MSGRGPTSFKKKQKEQQRREKLQEKIAKRLERKRQSQSGSGLAVDPKQVEQPEAGAPSLQHNESPPIYGDKSN